MLQSFDHKSYIYLTAQHSSSEFGWLACYKLPTPQTSVEQEGGTPQNNSPLWAANWEHTVAWKTWKNPMIIRNWQRTMASTQMFKIYFHISIFIRSSTKNAETWQDQLSSSHLTAPKSLVAKEYPCLHCKYMQHRCMSMHSSWRAHTWMFHHLISHQCKTGKVIPVHFVAIPWSPSLELQMESWFSQSSNTFSLFWTQENGKQNSRRMKN